MLKLITLKIYNDCAPHIRKCLKPDVYYYFSNDFYFDRQGSLVYRDSNLHSLHSDFFEILENESTEAIEKNDIQINVSAIVGKNGDGKSSLVEIIIRLINNLIVSAKLYKTPLQYISGLRAELVYRLDNVIYRIEDRDGQGTQLIRYATISETSNDILIVNQQEHLDKHHPIGSIFYTWISNHSHYAYNVYDYKKEWSADPISVSTEEQANEACWLYNIFDKNDGYMAPIAFHPYRYSGNIDINREQFLTEQRLRALFINSTDSINSFRNITGNKAVAIKLLPESFSKLQKRTLEDYFLSVREQNDNLKWAYAKLAEAYRKPTQISEITLETWYDNEREYVIDLLDELTGVSKSVKTTASGNGVSYSTYLREMDIYVRQHIPHVFSNNKYENYHKEYSDITRYLHTLTAIDGLKQIGKLPIEWLGDLKIDEQIGKYERYQDYNIPQLARIYLIYQVAKHYDINPLIVCKSYDELSYTEKAQHYLIYKTISIFHTYPSYIELIKQKKLPWDACYEYTENELIELFGLLKTDKDSDSHITRKLSQTIHYIDNCPKRGEVYQYLSDKEDNSIVKTWSAPNEVVLGLDTIKHCYRNGRIKLSELPPPIFKCEILFQRDGSYVTMDALSSGEKQMLNIIGAIVYHLQNIDSGKKYQSVNIVLEEIELYFHPEFQRQIIYRLIKQIKGEELPNIKSVNILFVTHSPFILSDIPKENVLFLTNGAPDTQMQENTFGANIHTLLKNGFFLPNLAMGEFAYHKINRLFAKLNANNVAVDEIEGMNKEITMVGEPYLREQLFKKFYSLPQVKQYFETLMKQ